MSTTAEYPVAVRSGKGWRVYFEAEEWSTADVRRMVARNMANLKAGGREAGDVIRQARGKLSVAELAATIRRPVADVKALERNGVVELAARELVEEVYGKLAPAPLDLLTKPFDPVAVAAAIRDARAGRDVAEIEAIVAINRRLLAGLETPDAWHSTAVARDILWALKRHAAKPPAGFRSLAEAFGRPAGLALRGSATWWAEAFESELKTNSMFKEAPSAAEAWGDFVTLACANRDEAKKFTKAFSFLESKGLIE